MYKLRHLPSAIVDAEEIEAGLSEFSISAADKFAESVSQKTDALIDNPYLYRVYQARPYFRCMPLPYEYLCFYHVDEDSKTVSIHRIIHGMRDIPRKL